MASHAELPRKPFSHLINILKATRAHHPNFALFLGAGASATSGVPMAAQLVEIWRKQYHESYAPNMPLEECLRQCSWHNSHEEYSILFEMLYDQPSQRREFIESCLETASPSWGYIYLVNLIKHGVFNTVFTTNFDDLLNEACYQFSGDVRPIVCAHDSSIRSVRMTAKRPKIIKLHGDFLFDNIKNTMAELESLEQNMKDKFKQFANEYGLIVLGYGGCDRSVMDSLSSMLRSDDNFPHGVYWCVRADSPIPPAVHNLGRFPRFKIVTIDGFDEFFSELHHSFKLSLQPELSDPYGSLTKRLNSLLTKASDSEKKLHRYIEDDIRSVGANIERSGTNLSRALAKPPGRDAAKASNNESSTKPISLPYQLLAQVQQRMGKFENAIKLLLEDLSIAPKASVFESAAELIELHDLKTYVPKLMTILRSSPQAFLKSPSSTFNIAVSMINAKELDAADEILDIGLAAKQQAEPTVYWNDAYYTINKLQVKRHRGEQLREGDVESLNLIAARTDPLCRAAANILLEHYEKSEQLLEVMLQAKILTPKAFASWPIFKLIHPKLTSVYLKSELQQHLNSASGSSRFGISAHNSIYNAELASANVQKSVPTELIPKPSEGTPVPKKARRRTTRPTKG